MLLPPATAPRMPAAGQASMIKARRCDSGRDRLFALFEGEVEFIQKGCGARVNGRPPSTFRQDAR